MFSPMESLRFPQSSFTCFVVQSPCNYVIFIWSGACHHHVLQHGIAVYVQISVYVGIQEFVSESSLFNVYIWCSQFLKSMESLWFKQLSTVILFSLLSTRVRNVPPKMLRCKWFKSQVPNEVKARLKRSTKRGQQVALETPAPKSNAKYKPRI